MTMRARWGALLVLLLLVGAALGLSTRVAAPSPVPMRIDGRALDATGVPLPVGTPIRAFVDGAEYSNRPSVTGANGAFSIEILGNFMINATTPETPDIKEGADFGEEVIFMTGDATTLGVFIEAIAWSPATSVTRDLRLALPATTPEPIRIQGIVVRPALGGPQFMFLCNPTGTPVNVATYYLELDRPGTYRGPRINLTGVVPSNGQLRVDLGSTTFLNFTGDALKLAFENPGGAGASAGGQDVVVDRLEYNATARGSLAWEPGNTIMGDAPAPGPGQILERTACADTDSLADFHIAREPGLPPNAAPVVSLIAPTQGSTVPPAQPFTVQWTMSDDLFASGELLVWVNVSHSGGNETLLSGIAGATSVTWNVPDLQAQDAVVTVHVSDPFGERGTATSGPFIIGRAQPSGDLIMFLGIGAALAAAVGVALFVLWRRRKKLPPTAPQAPPPAGPVPAQPRAPQPGKKACPRCGNLIAEADWTCFYCGYAFPGQP